MVVAMALQASPTQASSVNAVRLGFVAGSSPPGKCRLGLARNRQRGAGSLVVRAAILEAPGVGVERVDMSDFVKEAMPGGIAAQDLLGTGRRKRAIARVCLVEGTGQYVINNRTAQEYLQGNPLWLFHVKLPLRSLGFEGKYDTIVKAHGGGLSGQAQAIRLGISRCLLKINESHRQPLRKLGFLTRDPRKVERKKAGKHKARKSPQYSKR
ncbi:uncharacterized protein LOC9651621 [Selaginella moellendorffii]|nr:uncharacterized protein LOC9651621 [Selaginella moellendorffii]|eukprot:XP_002968659.2 uncharacterized protein LOC9651621 [Selaginella moellendorffii]